MQRYHSQGASNIALARHTIDRSTGRASTLVCNHLPPVRSYHSKIESMREDKKRHCVHRFHQLNGLLIRQLVDNHHPLDAVRRRKLFDDARDFAFVRQWLVSLRLHWFERFENRREAKHRVGNNGFRPPKNKAPKLQLAAFPHPTT